MLESSLKDSILSDMRMDLLRKDPPVMQIFTGVYNTEMKRQINFSALFMQFLHVHTFNFFFF